MSRRASVAAIGMPLVPRDHHNAGFPGTPRTIAGWRPLPAAACHITPLRLCDRKLADEAVKWGSKQVAYAFEGCPICV